MHPARPTAFLLFVSFFWLHNPLHAETAPAANPWEQALSFEYNAAADRLAALHKASPSDARVALGYASALLARQPRTQATLREAHRVLGTALANTAASPDERAGALYLLARIEQDHLVPPQPGAALARYEQLLREHPGHLLADQAAVNLALIAVADRAHTPASSVITRLETLLAGVKSPGASRELHFFLANLHWRERHDAPAAIRHLLAVRLIGCEQPMRNADIDLSIANLARETGDTALARIHYEAFLAQRPRDVRASTVRTALASLQPPAASRP